MKVLLLGPYPPPHGGVEISLASLHDFLQGRGIPCEVINLTRHRKAEGRGVYYPKSALELVRLLLRKNAEIIHLHIGGDVSWRLLGLAMICSLLPGRKLLLTLHSGGYPVSPAGKAGRPISLRGFLFRRFDGVIVVNQALVGTFVNFGLPLSKIRLIPPFSLPAEVPEVELPESISEFIATHRPVLLSVNGLEPEYDLPLQIEALGRIRNSSPGAGLLIVGTGSLAMELRKQIEATAYAEHVLLAGDAPNQVVLRMMSLSQILLRTTLFDGDSIAIREALHFGLPVIATDTGMRPEGVTLIPVGQVDPLCRAVQSVLEKSQARRTSPGADTSNLSAIVRFYEEVLNA